MAGYFGDNVRKNRERKGMSQADVAREMAARGWDWYPSTVNKIEHADRRTEGIEVHDLAEILGVPMAHLFWAPAEVNESGMVYRAIGILATEWSEAAQAIHGLFRARALARRTLSQSANSKYERVRTTCGELAAELEDRTLQAAVDEGYARFMHPEEEESGDERS